MIRKNFMLITLRASRVKSSNKVIDVDRYWTIISLLKLSDHSDLRLNTAFQTLVKALDLFFFYAWALSTSI